MATSRQPPDGNQSRQSPDKTRSRAKRPPPVASSGSRGPRSPKVPKPHKPYQQYDFEALKDVYIHGDMNMVQLSETWNVPLEYIRIQAAKGHWTAEREATRAAFRQKVRRQAAEKRLQWAEDYSTESFQIAMSAQRILGERLAEYGRWLVEHHQEIRQTWDRSLVARGVSRQMLWGPFTPIDMERMARAFLIFQEMGLKALGLSESQTPGTPNEVEQVIGSHNRRDDSDTLAKITEVMIRAGLAPQLAADLGIDNTVEAEVIEDTEPPPS
jgi:hypothetical protein